MHTIRALHRPKTWIFQKRNHNILSWINNKILNLVGLVNPFERVFSSSWPLWLCLHPNLWLQHSSSLNVSILSPQLAIYIYMDEFWSKDMSQIMTAARGLAFTDKPERQLDKNSLSRHMPFLTKSKHAPFLTKEITKLIWTSRKNNYFSIYQWRVLIVLFIKGIIKL